MQYHCRCSMLEIYNESVYDLLNASGEDLDLHLKPQTEEVYVKGLSWEEVKTGKQAHTDASFPLHHVNAWTCSNLDYQAGSCSHGSNTCMCSCRRLCLLPLQRLCRSHAYQF